jgi:DNA-binding NtrC family response regulator
MSPAAQAKLLRVLEEGTVRRVGENQPVPVDVRILAATNRDLPAAVAAGEFREDLYYRLSVVTLVVPPLRERREDIVPLARTFLAESVRRLGKLRVFAPEVPALLESYVFPGNVRELRYAIEQAAILSEDGTIRTSDFALTGEVRADGAGRQRGQGSHRVSRDITPERIRRALEESGGNRVRAARALGISRATFYRLLDRKGKDAAAGDAEGSESDV